MKRKISSILLVVLCNFLQGAFVGIKDTSQKNKFLGPDTSLCQPHDTSCRPTTQNSSALYVDNFTHTVDVLGINILDDAYQHEIIYIYNDFMYWLGRKQKAIQDQMMVMNQTAKQVQQDSQFMNSWKGSGVYQIMLSSSPAITNLVARDMPCPAGAYKVAAILAWCDGTDVAPVSAHCICLQKTDAFELVIEGKQTRDAQPLGHTQVFDTLATKGSVNFSVDVGQSPQQITLVKK